MNLGIIQPVAPIAIISSSVRTSLSLLPEFVDAVAVTLVVVVTTSSGSVVLFCDKYSSTFWLFELLDDSEEVLLLIREYKSKSSTFVSDKLGHHIQNSLKSVK